VIFASIGVRPEEERRPDRLWLISWFSWRPAFAVSVMFANAWLRIYLPWISAVLSGLLRTRGGSYIRWVSGVRFVTKLVNSPLGRDPALPLKQEGALICDRGAAEGSVLMRQGVLRGREEMRPGRSGRWGVSLGGMVWSRNWLLPAQSGSTVWCLGARHRLALRRPHARCLRAADPGDPRPDGRGDARRHTEKCPSCAHRAAPSSTHQAPCPVRRLAPDRNTSGSWPDRPATP
jgi:hypothetical protein